VYWNSAKFALALFFNIVKLTHKKPGRKRMFERSAKKIAAQGRWPGWRVARPSRWPCWAGRAGGAGSDDWAAYHGNGAGDHFSPLTQIDRSNVASLAPAWRIETGQGGLQTTPLVIDGVLMP
jgi:quinoprotein glucose dehydrogenase